eukprot:Lithocolla_globosa_v1_NODE_629_length_3565_cov_4.135897.p3 type:complete len:120 gc:universal NODE_629_length_3565_cov_4.135897:967-1326(+)
MNVETWWEVMNVFARQDTWGRQLRMPMLCAWTMTVLASAQLRELNVKIPSRATYVIVLRAIRVPWSKMLRSRARIWTALAAAPPQATALARTSLVGMSVAVRKDMWVFQSKIKRQHAWI